MRWLKKHLLSLVAGFGGLVLVSGLAFYFGIVREPDINSTNPLSVIFGWQWIYLFITGVIMLILATIKRTIRLLKLATVTLISLLIVFVPAQLIFSRGLYITGDGAPAGPEFNCLVWNRASTRSYMAVYNRGVGLCSLMSIPSLNKFLIDRSYKADQSDGSLSYYVVLAINEAVIIGGLILAKKKSLHPGSS